jgi:ABC-2 type transport system permease protein
MLATDVPAVQALGQCIFLPMLIVGGIAVPLANLPGWAQHVSAFLPGRYSVEVIQSCVTGTGAAAARFDVLLLILIGAAGAAAGLLAFRWDSRQRPSRWIALALVGWVAAGLAAESRGVVHTETVQREEQHTVAEYLPPPSAPPAPETTPGTKSTSAKPVATAKPSRIPANWEDVTRNDIEDVAFDRLPPDTGVVAPIAADDETPDAPTAEQVEQVRTSLATWAPGKVADPVQRVRNLLYVASVSDVYRLYPLEKFVPQVVFDQIDSVSAASDLPKILYFIAVHPNDGAVSAASELHALGLPDAPIDMGNMRNRSMLYAFKLLGRITAVPGKK